MDESFFVIEHGQKNIKNIKIFCLSWNTQSKLICKNRNTTTIPGLYYGSHDCVQPDFFDQIKDKIESCDVFVFSNQEEDSISEQHNWMNNEIKDLGFDKVNFVEMLGIGKTSKSTGRRRGLRMSIYVKSKYIVDSSTNNYSCGGLISSYITTNKGGISITLTIGKRTFLFCNVHLPFDASSLKKVYDSENIDIDVRQRLLAVREQNNCLNEALKKFVLNKTIDSIFVMGDMNYRLYPYNQIRDRYSSIHKPKLKELLYNNQFNEAYKEYDELYKSIQNRTIEINFKEGKNNEGITFPPTCKMSNYNKHDKHDNQDRCKSSFKEECYKLGENEWRIPSFCDRILYYDMSNYPKTKCLVYESHSSKAINISDHNMVYGIFNSEF